MIETIIIGVGCFIIGLWCGINITQTKNEIRTEGQKVLVIKPSKFLTTEESEAVEEKIKINKNGIVIVPNYCEYKFGEIERLVITGSVNKV